MRPFVRRYSEPGERVLDPFAGLGTTLLAAALERRHGVGYEIDAERVALARERLQRHGVADVDLTPGSIAAAARDAAPDIDLILSNVPYFAADGGFTNRPRPEQLYASSSYAEHLHGLVGAELHRGRCKVLEHADLRHWLLALGYAPGQQLQRRLHGIDAHGHVD